jgi:hypothetical protein
VSLNPLAKSAGLEGDIMDGTAMPIRIGRAAPWLASRGIRLGKVWRKPEQIALRYTVTPSFRPALTVELQYNEKHHAFELQRRSPFQAQTIEGIDQGVVRRLLAELLRSALPVDRGWVIGLDGANHELSIAQGFNRMQLSWWSTGANLHPSVERLRAFLDRWLSTPCAICGEPLPADETGCEVSEPRPTLGHPLAGYCDAGVHLHCHYDRHQLAQGLLCTDEVYVAAHPAHPTESLSVWLWKPWLHVCVPFGEWEARLASPAAWAGELLHDGERTALAGVLPLLRERLPTRDAVLGAIDWPHWEATVAAREAADAAQERERRERALAYRATQQRQLERHNAACRELASTIAAVGLTCPHCGTHSKDYELLDRRPEQKWCFVCRACARSLRPADWGL